MIPSVKTGRQRLLPAGLILYQAFFFPGFGIRT